MTMKGFGVVSAGFAPESSRNPGSPLKTKAGWGSINPGVTFARLPGQKP